MQSNNDFRSRLPLPKSVFRSTMIDPRSRSTSTSMFAESAVNSVNMRMSSTCIKPTIRHMTSTSTAIRTAVRLGPHPYLSSTVRPSLRTAFKLPAIETNVGSGQVVTRLDFDSETRNSTQSSPNASAGTNLNASISSKASIQSPVKSPSTIDWNAIQKEAELVALKTNVSRLEGLLEESKLKSSKKCVEYELKIENLSKEVERERNKCSEVENQMKQTERKCDDLSLQLNNAREEFNKEYERYEKRINEMNRTFADIRSQLSDTQSATDSVKARHQSEVLSLEHQIQTLSSQLSQYQSERLVLESHIQGLEMETKQKEDLDSELTAVKAEVRLLSEELQSYKDGIKLSSILENELKELKDLREHNRELRLSNDILSDVHSKNLILEEKIIGLESQLRAANEKMRQSFVSDLESIELRKRLQEWETALASDSPARVSAYLSELQTKELTLRSDLGKLRAKVNELQTEKTRFETDFNANKRKVEEQNELIKKLNRKCLLFIKERDSYKRLISSYEQDVTLDWNKVNNERLTELESLLEEYRSLIDQLETETKQLRTEHKVDEFKKQINQLKDELRRYQELNAQYENIQSSAQSQTHKNDGYRVIHFSKNPVSGDYERQRVEFKRITEENERLSAKLQLLESGCDADVTRQLDEGIKSRQELEKLQKQLASAQKRQQNIVEAFKKTSKEFREVCWRLTGFRIDLLKQQNTYRLSNIYSDSPEDFLLFELEANNTIKLLENEYSRRLSDSVNIYLTEHDSYPAFLASLTLDLFRKQTILQTNR